MTDPPWTLIDLCAAAAIVGIVAYVAVRYWP